MAVRRKRTRPGRIDQKTGPARPAQPRADPGLRRARLWLLGSVVLAAAILFAWFPGSSLLNQRSSLSATKSELASLHKQDGALAQEKKDLSDAGEIGRIARSQYQLVSPGQQSYEVLPASGAAAQGTSYGGDPGSSGPVAPSASAELPSGTTTTTAPAVGSASAATHEAHGTPGAHGANAASAPPAPGLLSRMLHSLEFWR